MPFLRRLAKDLFKAPYPLFPCAVFAYVVLCFILNPSSPLRTGLLADPDDYMRLNEVISWLSGQSWFDLSHPRLSQGMHTVVHWSRLVDLPIALLMLPLTKVYGLQGAAFAASLVVPLALFGVLLALLPRLACAFAENKRANLAALLVLFAPLTLFNFTPGRVDHHAWQILIAGFGLLCLDRMIGDERGWRHSVAAAIAFACGLWIGTEAMPWLILFCACLAVAGALRGGFILRNAAVFGVALAFATTALLPIALPREEWASRALSWFSSADVIFAGLIGALFVVGWVVTSVLDCPLPARGRGHGGPRFYCALRLSLFAALGFFAAMLFLYLVPDAFGGPYADYDAYDSGTALDHINEAMPLIKSFLIDVHNGFTYKPALLTFLHLVFLPLIAFGAALRMAWAAPERQRATRAAHAAFLGVSILLTLFWQVRVGWFMQFFMLAPLTSLLTAWWNKIGAATRGDARLAARLCAFLALGPLPVVFLPALFHDAKFASEVVLFPAARAQEACALKPVADYLAEPWALGEKPLTILAGSSEGPELLFRTPHRVIAANYNVPGNSDVFDFFAARDEAAAKRIARKWNVDLVLTCRHMPRIYMGQGLGKPPFLAPAADGKLRLTQRSANQGLIEKLVNGEAPDWLEPVVIPFENDYLLFRIHLAPLNRK